MRSIWPTKITFYEFCAWDISYPAESSKPIWVPVKALSIGSLEHLCIKGLRLGILQRVKGVAYGCKHDVFVFLASLAGIFQTTSILLHGCKHDLLVVLALLANELPTGYILLHGCEYNLAVVLACFPNDL